MNTHEATEIEVENNGEATYVSTCANCNQRIERAEYYDDDRGYFLAKNWSVVTWHDSETTAGVRYARHATECLPVLA